MAASTILLADLISGSCSNTVEVRFHWDYPHGQPDTFQAVLVPQWRAADFFG